MILVVCLSLVVIPEELLQRGERDPLHWSPLLTFAEPV
jgi:hypothetical protein